MQAVNLPVQVAVAPVNNTQEIQNDVENKKLVTLYAGEGTKVTNHNDVNANALAPEDNTANIIIKSKIPIDFEEGTVLIKDGIQYVLLTSNSTEGVVNKHKLRYTIDLLPGTRVGLINEQITVENVEITKKVITRTAEIIVPAETYLKIGAGQGVVVKLANDEKFKLLHQ
jgi:hypothetical protein